jgi:DNA-binding CsgD family transcriptional regulator
VYDQVGAQRDAARALASMRKLGLGRKRRGARRRPADDWESLTPSELEVVHLAAEGLTNPQIGQRLFISPRTVQTHLAHAFRKLGISSRVELAAEVARRTITP